MCGVGGIRTTGVVIGTDIGLESCRLSNAVLRLFAKGSILAVTIEYCRCLRVTDSSLEVSDDNLIGVVSVPVIGVFGMG